MNKKHLLFQDVIYYCVFLFFSIARNVLAFVTKGTDKSEKH